MNTSFCSLRETVVQPPSTPWTFHLSVPSPSFDLGIELTVNREPMSECDHCFFAMCTLWHLQACLTGTCPAHPAHKHHTKTPSSGTVDSDASAVILASPRRPPPATGRVSSHWAFDASRVSVQPPRSAVRANRARGVVASWARGDIWITGSTRFDFGRM